MKNLFVTFFLSSLLCTSISALEKNLEDRECKQLDFLTSEKSSHSNEEVLPIDDIDAARHQQSLKQLYSLWKEVNIHSSSKKSKKQLTTLTDQGPITLHEQNIRLAKLGASLGFQPSLVPMKGYTTYDFSIGNTTGLIESDRGLIYLNLNNQSLAGFNAIINDPFLVIRTKPSKKAPSLNINDSWENFAHFNAIDPIAQPKLLLNHPQANVQKTSAQDLKSSCSHQTFIENKEECFDHVIPSFLIRSEIQECESVWWQISETPDFSFVIPNFEGVHEFQSTITLDALTDTFFNNDSNYFFRAKTKSSEGWGQWSTPYEFHITKPEAAQNITFKKISSNHFELQWDQSTDPEITYLIFASNSRDFVPSIYCDKQINELSNSEIIDAELNQNHVCQTKENRLKINRKFAYYRIIAEKKAHYSTPSPLIYIYDYGLTHSRDVLQLNDDTLNPTAKRIKYPTAYRYISLRDPLFAYREESFSSLDTIADIAGFEKFVKSPYVDKSVWNIVEPFLLPENHPIKDQLDRMFSASRIILSSKTLEKEGFPTPHPRPFSHAIVSHHPNLTGYLVKMFSDSQPKLIDWKQWMQRITGALCVQEAVINHSYEKFYKVPKKWIYPLPPEPSPPFGYYRKNFILIVEDMNILSKDASYAKWKSDYITPEKLDSFYTLLDELGLNDNVQIFNMPIAKDGKFAFIDTERHHHWPVRYQNVLKNLSPEMRIYWKQLMDNKGPATK